MSSSPVDGKVVVLTGKFSNLKRAVASKQLAAMGAVIGKGVTKKTDILIAGEKAGSKITKAGSLGVAVKDESWLQAVLSGVDPDGAAAIGDEVAELDAAGLEALLAGTDWSSLSPARDLPPVVAALHALERAGGVTDLHRAFSDAVLSAHPHRVAHSRVHRNRITCMGMSPCGRYLATGCESPYADYDAGGSMAIWELACGRVVSAIYDVGGGVGWSENAGCIQWFEGQEMIAAVHSTNGVGTFAPFDNRGGELMTAYVTNGWDSAPTFRVSPDGEQLCISCWGGDSSLAGGVMPTTQGLHLGDSSHQIRWFSDAGLPDGLNLQNWRVDMGWHRDGWLYGMNARHGQAYAVSAKTLSLKWHTQIHAPAAFSPDGDFLAHNPAGLVIYDGRTGKPTVQLPMIVGGTDVLWSPVAEQRRLALVVGPKNKFGSDPGVHIFDSGELVATIHDAPRRDAAHWNFPDASQLVFSPDGERAALITAGGKAAIWSLANKGEKLRELDISDRAQGLLWGAGGILVAVGHSILEFWDLERGVLLSSQDMLPPPGMNDPLPGPGSWQAGLPGARSYCPIPNSDTRRWRWLVAPPEGPVICEDRDLDALDQHLALTLAGGRVGWPWRWAVGTPHASPITDPAAVPHKTIKSLWSRALGLSWVASSGTEGFKKVEQDGATVQLATAPLSRYHAPKPLHGEALTPAAMQQFVGRSVLYAEDWRPRYISIVTVTSVSPDGSAQYFYKSGNSSGSGSMSLSSLLWIGEARWIGA